MIRKDKILVLGYGSQGRAIAMNLRDSGYSVSVGLRPRSKSRLLARNEKLRVLDINSNKREIPIIIVALPDHVHEEVLNNRFLVSLGDKTQLVFLHGASIHFKLVRPPVNTSVLLLAPHAPGSAVRGNYLNKRPYSAFYGVAQGPKNKGHQTLKKLAGSIGIPSSHLIKTTFADEAIGDIFGEQAVLCGGLTRLLKLGFETLLEAGMPPQNAYLEVAYQLDLIVELVKKYGLAGMFDRISPLAKYGSAANGPRVIPNSVKRNMTTVLKEIKSGRFIKSGVKRKLQTTEKQLAQITNTAFDQQVKKFSGK
jgi:ketol-acid reductoisomerase